MSALCTHGADKEQNIHSDRFQETAPGRAGAADKQAPSQQAGLQVGFQEGALLVPLTPGKGPTMSPGAGWGEVRGREGRRKAGRGGRKEERGRPGLQPGLRPSVVSAALREPKLAMLLLESSVSPFGGHTISAGPWALWSVSRKTHS